MAWRRRRGSANRCRSGRRATPSRSSLLSGMAPSRCDQRRRLRPSGSTSNGPETVAVVLKRFGGSRCIPQRRPLEPARRFLPVYATDPGFHARLYMDLMAPRIQPDEAPAVRVVYGHNGAAATRVAQATRWWRIARTAGTEAPRTIPALCSRALRRRWRCTTGGPTAPAAPLSWSAAGTHRWSWSWWLGSSAPWWLRPCSRLPRSA